ncbi:alpha/beta hydrolase [Rathayibacter sp. YIM 133350]|uniref:alpha/beta fold hydrolase n=1 Tax=Rathayibacter sp. YIM 133350 TaxID=3131992 RepID=UPI00307E58DF
MKTRRAGASAQPQYSREERFTHDDLTLVAKHLDGPTDALFVLVHGIGVASRYFGPLARALAPYGAVIALELPGMGSTPEPRHAASIERYADLLAAWARHENLADATVVGHSMGTQITTEFALRAPDAVGRVVLIGAVTNPAERSVTKQALRLAQDSLKERLDVNLIVFTDYLRCGPRWMLKIAPVMRDYPLLTRAARVSQPALVMRGEHDPISPRVWNRAIAGALPAGTMVELPGQAHVGMYTDAERASGIIATFAQGGQATRSAPRQNTSAP